MLRDSLNNFLSPKGLNVCTVVFDYWDIDDEVIRVMDKKYPKYNAPTDYYENHLQQAITKYRKKNQIDKSSFESIITFLDDCQVEEYDRRRRKTKELKEKRKKCKKTICWKIGELLKDGLHNPRSFEFVSCELMNFNETYFKLRYTYRAKNGFNALVLDEVVAKANYQSCSDLTFEE